MRSSPVGFPLVGGPATGSMEPRATDESCYKKKILTAKRMCHILSPLLKFGYLFLDTPRHWGLQGWRCCTPCRNWMGQSSEVPRRLGGREHLFNSRTSARRLIGRLNAGLPCGPDTARAANCDCAVRLRLVTVLRDGCLAECAAIAPQIPSRRAKRPKATVGGCRRRGRVIRRVKRG